MEKIDILQPLKRNILFIFVLGFFFNLSQLVYPVYMLQVYEKVLTSFSNDTLLYLVLLAATLSILGAITDALRKSMLSGISLRVNKKLLPPLLSLIARKDGRNAEKNSYLGDLEYLISYISGGTINTLLDILWMPVFVLAIFLIHPYLGFVALSVISINIIFAIINQRSTQELTRTADKLSSQQRQFESCYNQNYDSLEGSALSTNYTNSILASQNLLASNKLNITSINNKLHATTTALKSIGQILTLGIGAMLVIEGLISPGVMIVATIIYGRALQPIGNLLSVYQLSKRAIQCFNRLDSFINIQQSFPNHPLHAQNGHLRIQNLVISIPNTNAPIIKGISFELYSGDSLALYGNARSGKSTLLRTIAGVWQPSNGSVTVDKINTSTWSRIEFSHSVGYLSQTTQLLPGTIRENIAQFNEVEDRTIIKAAQLAGVHHYILELAEGYDTPIYNQNIHISNGVLQLIAIARCLVTSPKLLLLDEPFSSLSVNMKNHLLNSLKVLKEDGVTIIVATSANEELAFTNKIMVLSRGTIGMFNTRNKGNTEQSEQTQPILENQA